jgi:hypothetical protein
LLRRRVDDVTGPRSLMAFPPGSKSNALDRLTQGLISVNALKSLARFRIKRLISRKTAKSSNRPKMQFQRKSVNAGAVNLVPLHFDRIQ